MITTESATNSGRLLQKSQGLSTASPGLFAPRNDLSVLMQVIEIADKPCGVTPAGTWLYEKRELSRNAAGQLCEHPL